MRSLHMGPQHAPSALDDLLDAECCSPTCSAPPNPELPIPMCSPCAGRIAIAYHVRVSHDDAPDQSEADRGRAASGELGDVGWVYFVRFGTRIKIGFTTNLRQRMGEIPHDEVLGVVKGVYMRDERQCHRLFADSRVYREWFEDTPRLREFIASVATDSLQGVA